MKRANQKELNQNGDEQKFEVLLKNKLRQIDQPDPKNIPKIEEMLHKYFRFKIFWKQESIKKFLEGYLGLKMSHMKDFQKMSQNSGKLKNIFLLIWRKIEIASNSTKFKKQSG